MSPDGRSAAARAFTVTLDLFVQELNSGPLKLSNCVPNGCFQQYLRLVSGLPDGVCWSMPAAAATTHKRPFAASFPLPNFSHSFICLDGSFGRPDKLPIRLEMGKADGIASNASAIRTMTPVRRCISGRPGIQRSSPILLNPLANLIPEMRLDLFPVRIDFKMRLVPTQRP